MRTSHPSGRLQLASEGQTVIETDRGNLGAHRQYVDGRSR